MEEEVEGVGAEEATEEMEGLGLTSLLLGGDPGAGDGEATAEPGSQGSQRRC